MYGFTSRTDVGNTFLETKYLDDVITKWYLKTVFLNRL